MEENIVRATANEREALMRLNLIVDIANTCREGLKRRTPMVKNLNRDMALLVSLSKRILDNVLKTVPDEQLVSLMRNIRGVEYAVGAARPWGGPNRENDKFGVWVSFNDLNSILSAVTDHCVICDMDAGFERGCKLRKALDNIGSEVDHTGGCGYRDRIG